MKKTILFILVLIHIAVFTSCTSARENTSKVPTSDTGKAIMEMELDRRTDEPELYTYGRLFCVSEDMDTLTVKIMLEMDGKRKTLEVKNNKTNEVLWSDTWEGMIESEMISIPLKNLKKDEEYTIYVTGRKVRNAAIEITYDVDA